MRKGIFALLLITAGLVFVGMKPLQEDELSKSMVRGKELYSSSCVTCHMEDGTGLEGVYPPLANADYLKKSTENAIRAIKFGQEGEVTVNGVAYNSSMPASGLSDQEIADIMNYIQNSWGNKGKFVSAADVEKVKN